MNTTAAATQAGVTVATIRDWARRNIITATKRAGRWIIDAASLAHRIAIGNRRTRKAITMQLDLTATYTYGRPHGAGAAPTTITPKVRDRVRDGERVISVRGLAPLLADRIDAIADEGDRLHTLEALYSASITISDQPGEFDSLIATRDEGRLATTYQGTADLTRDDVLDLAERLRTQLFR